MRSLETNAGRGRRERGFSLLEMMIVLAISIVASVISVVSLIPLLQQQRVNNAYNTTLSAMRQARDNAVSQRTSYSVTFANGTSTSTITVTPTLLGFQGDQNTAVYNFPAGVSFLVPPSGATAPDNFGTGSNAIDFGYTSNSNSGGGNVIYFCPDGSAQTLSTCAGPGNWDNGVVYLARSGDVGSFRAVDLWGGTGRVRGWRLYSGSGGYQWSRQ